MADPSALVARLDAIGESLAQREAALALIGLGSVGIEQDRLDAWSDLDFFVVVADGQVTTFLNNLDWLADVHPIAYSFANTTDGRKLLFADGIFCEYAIFEIQTLASIPFAPGRIVWKRPHIDPQIAIPRQSLPSSAPRDPAWLVGEALTNLYVGLGRYHRGERLIAQRFIQHYAVDRVVELANQLFAAPSSIHRDHFSPERRFEQRFPDVAAYLPSFMQGYQASPASALAILAWLEQHTQVDPALARAIRAFCE